MRVLQAHRFIWRLGGIWPQPSDSWPYRVYSVLIFVATSLIFNGCMLLRLVQHHTVDEAVECLLPATTTVMTTVKICIHLYNQRRFERLFALMRDLDAQLAESVAVTSEKAVTIRDVAVRRSRNLLLMISCSSYSAITLACVMVLLWGGADRRLMWPAWFPVDWEHNDGWYYGLVGFQYVSNMYIGMIYTSMNTYAPAMFIVLSAYLEMLGENLSRLGAAEHGTTSELGLRQCHDHHKACNRIGDMLNDLFGLHYAIHFCLSGLVICVTAFQLSVGQPLQNPSQFAFNCEYLFCMSIEIFMPCYYGSCLTLQSDEMTVQLYRCDWLRQSRRFGTAMGLVMQRSQRPVRMWTYQKLFAIQLSTFVGVRKRNRDRRR